MEQETSRFLNWVKSRAVTIFLTLLCIFYLFYGGVSFKLNDMGVLEKVLYGFSTLIFGVTVTGLVSEGGYTNGKKSTEYIETRTEAVRLSNDILPWKAEAELYVDREIDKKIATKREEMLKNQGLLYREWFAEDGKFLAHSTKGLKASQRKAIAKARLICKKPFCLLAYADTDMIGFSESPSESKRRAKKGVSSFVSRLAMAVVSALVVFGWNDISIESVLFASFQLFLWIGSGLFERIGNYNFVTVKMRDYDRNRIAYMKSFMALDEAQKAVLRAELRGDKPLMIENKGGNADGR